MSDASPFRFWKIGLKRFYSRWWVRTIMGAPFTLLLFAGAFRDYVVAPEYRNLYLWHYIPSVRAYGYVYIIALLLLILISFIFAAPDASKAALVARDDEHEKALAKKSETFKRYRERVKRNTQPVLAPVGILAEPHILQRPVELVWVRQDNDGYFVECDESDSSKQALVVPYRNERMRSRRVGDAELVSGEISWKSHDGGLFSIPAHPVVWLSEKADTVSFRRDGEPYKVVLVTVEADKFYAVHRQAGGLGKPVRETLLKGNIWRGKIDLFAKNETTPICKSDYVVEASPKSELERASPMSFWRAMNLHRMSVSGHHALFRHYEGQEINTAEFDYAAWEKETAEFIGRNYLPKEKSKFLFEHSARFVAAPVAPEDRLERQLAVLKGLENQAGI